MSHFHTFEISDLMSEERRGRPADMKHHVLSLSENISFKPLKLAGLMSYLVDIISIMCSSLWNNNLLWRIRFHWILDISDIWPHVVYHVQHHGLHAGLHNYLDFSSLS